MASIKILASGVSCTFGGLACIQLAENRHQMMQTIHSFQGKNEAIARDLQPKGLALVEMEAIKERKIKRR